MRFLLSHPSAARKRADKVHRFFQSALGRLHGCQAKGGEIVQIETALEKDMGFPREKEMASWRRLAPEIKIAVAMAEARC
jgi:hypothetical protein